MSALENHRNTRRFLGRGGQAHFRRVAADRNRSRLLEFSQEKCAMTVRLGKILGGGGNSALVSDHLDLAKKKECSGQINDGGLKYHSKFPGINIQKSQGIPGNTQKSKQK